MQNHQPDQISRPALSVDLAIAAHDRIADHWVTVESSYIDRIAFEATAQVLFVQFSSNAIYAYFDVSSVLWHDFLSADSKGRFLNAHIRNQLAYLCLGLQDEF